MFDCELGIFTGADVDCFVGCEEDCVAAGGLRGPPLVAGFCGIGLLGATACKRDKAMGIAEAIAEALRERVEYRK